MVVWLEGVDDEVERAHAPEPDDPDEPDDRDEPQLTGWPCASMHSREVIDAARAAVPVPNRISLMAVERLIARIPGREGNLSMLHDTSR